MTDDQYRRLVEFLGQQFFQVDGRFTQIDARFAQIDARFTQIDARFSQGGARFVQLEEQIAGLAGDLERFRGEVRAEFDETKSMIRLVDQRVERLESR
jgi:hypothetical protein